MKITIERTSMVVMAYGVPMHVWEGTTESGVRVACLVDHFMFESEDRRPELDQEMRTTREPSVAVVAAFPEAIELAPAQSRKRRRSGKPARSRNTERSHG